MAQQTARSVDAWESKDGNIYLVDDQGAGFDVADEIWTGNGPTHMRKILDGDTSEWSAPTVTLSDDDLDHMTLIATVTRGWPTVLRTAWMGDSGRMYFPASCLVVDEQDYPI